MGREQAKVEWEFRLLGEVTLEGGRLRFPRAEQRPGVYRFVVTDSDDSISVYVGEADLLARRFQHYRTPGPSQRANLRMNEAMTQILRHGGNVMVEIAVEAWHLRRERHARTG